MLNKRQKLFVNAYTDTLCPKTYENATQSALKAGYSEKNANNIGCKLLKKPIVAQRVKEINDERVERYSISIENAIVEAREKHLKYEASGNHRMAMFYYDKWLMLKGWNVNRQESTNTDKTELSQEQADKIGKAALAALVSAQEDHIKRIEERKN